MMKMIAAVMLLMVGLVTSSMVCPDGNECPDDYTCCKTQSGYGCCPAPDVLAKEPETLDSAAVGSESVSVSAIHCDSSTLCPDGTTCCRDPFGKWYCCPFAMGQCCRDGRHCCRHGYHCDSTSRHCLSGGFRVPASPHLPSWKVKTTED
ncbi:progranulin-like [Chanos chanos]|uniref:Progranulin-like n=1 Tax=Chanos chanos TaxID=29144 RepID=A0A6J2WJ27_CHACN|nr:progranulin-like [Chanos chanos]